MGGLAMNDKVLSFRRSGQPESTKPLHYKACGLDGVYLLNGFTRETVDGEEYVTIQDIDGLWKVIGLHLVTTRKTLSPKDIRFLRQQMELTQAELGAYLRVSDQTVARWEKGQSDPGPADLALRVLYLGSGAAQPEGTEILHRIMKLNEEIIERDDVREKPSLFEHGKKRWRESTRELECA
jgi:DNA-binding transcriptional regulator YiaG